VQEHCFYHLEAPIERVTGWDTPVSARLRVGLLPRAEAGGRSDEAGDERGRRLMGRFVFKLPDVGEGTAEAEVVTWHVKAGDTVTEDQPLADVMTDKATVELTSPVAGTVVSTHGEIGAMAAVGSALVVLEVEGRVTRRQRSCRRRRDRREPDAPRPRLSRTPPPTPRTRRRRRWPKPPRRRAATTRSSCPTWARARPRPSWSRGT
jgi:hypothetical protein